MNVWRESTKFFRRVVSKHGLIAAANVEGLLQVAEQRSSDGHYWVERGPHRVNGGWADRNGCFR